MRETEKLMNQERQIKIREFVFIWINHNEDFKAFQNGVFAL